LLAGVLVEVRCVGPEKEGAFGQPVFLRSAFDLDSGDEISIINLIIMGIGFQGNDDYTTNPAAAFPRWKNWRMQ